MYAFDPDNRWQWPAAATFFLLLGLAAWAFAAGLGGELIFDDIPNLSAWQQIGDIRHGRDLLAFATSGMGFPGRPLSLASFVLDDQSWQPDIYALKRTNLAIHLLNACLIFWLSLKLLAHLLPGRTPRARTWLALLITAIWTLHPMQVSNVSYVIQRMNLLSTLLELTGLLLFLRGRELLDGQPRRAVLLCSLAIGLFMPLAILAKENGLLLCAFALLVDHFCFSRPQWPWWRIWKAIFLWLPLIAVVADLLVTFRGFTLPYVTRDFNAWERLLTQGPVVQDYLGKLLMPRLQGSGLYFDNFPVSRSLLSSPRTLAAWLILGGGLAAAIRWRRRWPLLSFGVLFYFCGHLMESTVLPLELYFEHRNYLPQFGLWLGLAALVDRVLLHPRLRPLMQGGIAGLVLALVWMTHANAALWAQSDLQAAVWHHDNPGSIRTTLSYANALLKQRRLEEASRVLAQGQQLQPESLIMALGHVFVQCYLQDRATDFSMLPGIARHARYETASIEMLQRMWDVAQSSQGRPAPPGACTPASFHELAATYTALAENPAFSLGRTQAVLRSNLANYASLQRDLDTTIRQYDLAFASEPNPLYPYGQAMALASAGLPGPALDYLGRARGALTLRMRLAYPALEDNIATLEKALRQQVAHGAPRD